MNCALVLISPAHPKFANCELQIVLGRPIATYPMMVGLSCPSIDRVYLATENPELKSLGTALGAHVIKPCHSGGTVAEMASAGAAIIASMLARDGATLELLIIMFAHSATVTPQVVEGGIAAMCADRKLDAALSVSPIERWVPSRAFKMLKGNILEPYVSAGSDQSFDAALDDTPVNDDMWYADLGAIITRGDRIGRSDWLGQNVHAMRQLGAVPLVEPWQIPAIESWLQTNQIDQLFRVRRTRWSQFYDSERAILTTLQLSNHSTVLDIGSDPGGLGLALLERFATRSYTALVADETAAGEINIIYPEANVVVTDIGAHFRPSVDGFDLVCALDVSDTPAFLEKRLPLAFQYVIEGGTLVFSIRLTDGKSIKDHEKSYQVVGVGKGATTRRQYVVYNLAEVMDALAVLQPVKITAYGYLGHPSATAVTPLSEVCFAVFAVTRGVAEAAYATHLNLQLPPPYAN